MLATISRRFGLAVMSMLFVTMLFPLNFLPDTAFAQTRPTQCPQKKLCSLTAAAHPTSAGSSVTLNPNEAPAGSTVTGVGSNWASGDYILVQWYDGTTLGNTTVQSDGTFTVSFTVPSNAAQGSYTVSFTDQTAGYFIPATLTVGTCPTSSLTVQSAFTQDGNGNANSIFVPGNAIQYVVYINNTCGSSINTNFHFEDFWGTINDGAIEIFDSIFQNITVPAGVSGWYTQSTVPTNALPGSYTDRVGVFDENNLSNQSTGIGTFAVKGTVKLPGIKYYTQYAGQYAQNFDCGPASVGMALNYSGRGPGGSGKALTQIRQAATGKDLRKDTIGVQLEKALKHYGSSYFEISQYISNLSNPDVQETEMAAAIEQDQPIIAFVNVADMGKNSFGRSYAGHWLVVTGFYNDGTNTYIILNDPDNQAPRKGYPNWIKGGSAIQVLLSTFGYALINGRGLEPNDIAGIVVTS